MRDEVFPIHKGNGDKYIDMEKLFREDGTGYVQKLKQLNVENFKKGGRIGMDTAKLIFCVMKSSG